MGDGVKPHCLPYPEADRSKCFCHNLHSKSFIIVNICQRLGNTCETYPFLDERLNFKMDSKSH